MTLYGAMNPDKSVTAKASLGGWGREDEALSFPTWGEVLASRAEMKPDERSRWKFAIIGLLKFCKGVGRPVSITLIKEYLELMRGQGKLVAEPREAFLWFVAEARGASSRASLSEKFKVDPPTRVALWRDDHVVIGGAGGVRSGRWGRSIRRPRRGRRGSKNTKQGRVVVWRPDRRSGLHCGGRIGRCRRRGRRGWMGRSGNRRW